MWGNTNKIISFLIFFLYFYLPVFKRTRVEKQMNNEGLLERKKKMEDKSRKNITQEIL